MVQKADTGSDITGSNPTGRAYNDGDSNRLIGRMIGIESSPFRYVMFAFTQLTGQSHATLLAQCWMRRIAYTCNLRTSCNLSLIHI